MLRGVGGDAVRLQHDQANEEAIGATKRASEVEPQEAQAVRAGYVARRKVELREILDDPAATESRLSQRTSRIDHAHVEPTGLAAHQDVMQEEILVKDPRAVHAAGEARKVADQRAEAHRVRALRRRSGGAPMDQVEQRGVGAEVL